MAVSKRGLLALCLTVITEMSTVFSDGTTLAFEPNLLPSTLPADECSGLKETQTCALLSFRQSCPHFCNITCPRSSFVYIGYRGLCYGITSDESVMWSHAYELCRAYGARLAHIETGRDDTLVAYLQNISNTNSQTRFHSGAVNFGVVNEWVWLDGSPFNNLDPYSFWKRGYPKFGPNRPGCLNIFTEDEYKKENHRCNQNMGFICEQEPIIEDIDISDGTSFI